MKPIRKTQAEMIQFLTENVENTDKDLIEQAFKKAYIRKFNKEHKGIWSNDNGLIKYLSTYNPKLCRNENFLLDFNLSFEDNIERVKEILSPRQVTLQGYKDFRSNDSFFEFVRIKEDKTMTVYGYSNYYIIPFVQFIIGYRNADFTDFNKYFSSGEQPFTAQIENISIKRFANGRLDLKGLTPEQQAKFDELRSTYEKLRRFK